MRKFVLALTALAVSHPVRAADSELYTFHCLFGCPLGAPDTNDTLVQEIYTLSSNDLTKMADRVAYRVTPQTIAASQGPRNYRVDPRLDASETLDEPHHLTYQVSSILTMGTPELSKHS